MKTLFDAECIPERKRETLPPMIGSQKQVDWATHIRRSVLSEADRLIKDADRLAEAYERAGKCQPARSVRAYACRLSDKRNWLASRAVEAAFWIERRDNTAEEILEGEPARPGHTFERREPVPEFLRG